MKVGDITTVSQPDAGVSPKGAQVQSGVLVSGLKVDPCIITLTISGIPKAGGNEDGYMCVSRWDISTLAR